MSFKREPPQNKSANFLPFNKTAYQRSAQATTVDVLAKIMIVGKKRIEDGVLCTS